MRRKRIFERNQEKRQAAFPGWFTVRCVALAFARTLADCKVFFLTRTPQGGFSCRFAAIHLLSSEKTNKIVCCREAAKAATLLARAGVGCSKRGG